MNGSVERLIVSIIAAVGLGLIAGLLIFISGSSFSSSAAFAGRAALIWVPILFVGTLVNDVYKKRKGKGSAEK